MEIPRFWEKEEADETTPDGDSMELTCWGWSKEGPAEARAKAGELLQQLRHRLRQGAEPGRYAYGSRLVREEILRELPDAEGGLAAVVTRNVYGCEVLNTAGAMFIDVDLPPPRWSLGLLFGRRLSDPVEERVKALRQIIETDPWRAGRIYRTAAGLRLLITDRLYEPASADAEQLMTTCGADPPSSASAASRRASAHASPRNPGAAAPRVPPAAIRGKTGRSRKISIGGSPATKPRPPPGPPATSSPKPAAAGSTKRSHRSSVSTTRPPAAARVCHWRRSSSTRNRARNFRRGCRSAARSAPR